MDSPLPRTTAVIEDGIGQGLQLGAQVYVSVGGAPVADLALGSARAGVPMTTGHLITWFSLTKPTAAVCAAQLWERGELALDDPVVRFVPEFGAHGKDRITVRHLLTHTGGFRTADAVQSAAIDPAVWWAETIAAICAAEPEQGWAPGRRAGYHLRSGTMMLAEIVRRVDGRPFERCVREELFLPLGMEDCWVGMPPERAAAYGERLGTMHDTTRPADPKPLSNLDHPIALARCAPGGGGRGPMRQLGRLYEMLLTGGTLDGVRVLSPQGVEAMVARHRTGLYDETLGVVIDWGLGFSIDGGVMGPHCSPRTFGHGGAQSSLAFCDPEARMVAAIQVNGMPGSERHYLRFAAISRALYVDLGLAGEHDPGRDRQLPRAAGLATA